MVDVANRLVVALASSEFREASHRVLALIKKRAKAYRKNPSLANCFLLDAALDWADHIEALCECSCPQCWKAGAEVLKAVERLERGGFPQTDIVCRGRRP